MNPKIDSQVASRGERLRRLDILLAGLWVQREKLTQPDTLVYAYELQKFRDEARYCFLNAGQRAQKALKEVENVDFTKGVTASARSQRARHAWIDPSRCRVFDTESERQCTGKLDRLIRLVEEVRQIEETMDEVEPTSWASSRGVIARSAVRELSVPSKFESLSQSEAATALGISTRTVRAWTKQDRLNKTARGRIANDNKFIEEYQARNAALKK